MWGSCGGEWVMHYQCRALLEQQHLQPRVSVVDRVDEDVQGAAPRGEKGPPPPVVVLGTELEVAHDDGDLGASEEEDDEHLQCHAAGASQSASFVGLFWLFRPCVRARLPISVRARARAKARAREREGGIEGGNERERARESARARERKRAGLVCRTRKR